MRDRRWPTDPDSGIPPASRSPTVHAAGVVREDRLGDVFTRDVIDTWIDYKRKKEIDPVRLRPHPWEFYLYFDI